MIEIEGELAGIKGRWMTGLAGSDAAPSSWKPLLGDDSTDAELRLLALVGQALQVGFTPEPSDALQASRPLPVLALPAMPDEARRCFRRVVSDTTQSAESIAPILELIASRGYCTHPFDWMPGATDQHAPPLYAPWIDWLNNDISKSADETLNADNWESWFPAERRAAFTELRSADAAAARALLEAKASEVPADERLRLIELLTHKLSDADIPYLESLAKDRSGKVKVRAAQLLARLGAGTTDAELVAELADMLQLKRAKLLGSRKALGPKKLQNDAQRSRRLELLALVPLHAIAATFEQTPQQIVEGWQLSSSGPVNNAFTTMVAETGDDDVQVVLATRLMQSKTNNRSLYELIPRLALTDRQSLVPDALAIKDNLFQLASVLSRPALGQLPFEQIAATADFKSMTKAMVSSAKGDDSNHSEASINACMRSLGLMLDKQGAATLLDHATKSGLLSSDPQLNLLHLNAALAPHSHTSDTVPRSKP